VYCASRADEETLVAVKWFRPDLVGSRVSALAAGLERVIRADLAHPAIAAPIAAGTAGASVYLTCDFVLADPLDVGIRNYGPAPAADAVRVAAQLAGALDFAAVVNIRHGALHPRDVLVSPDEVRLTGLGVAQAVEEIGLAVPVRRPYTAPEIIAGRNWDRRADIFSLAAVIYELLWAKRVPAAGPGSGETMTSIAGGDLGALRRVFSRALADDPGARQETALAFAEELRQALTAASPADLGLPLQAGASSPTADLVSNGDRSSVPFDAADVLALELSSGDLTLRAVEAPQVEVEAPQLKEVAAASVIVPPVEAARRGATPAAVSSPVDTGVAAGSRSGTTEEAIDAAPFDSPLAGRSLRMTDLRTTPRRRSAIGPMVAALAAGVVLGFMVGRFTNVFGPASPRVATDSRTSPVATSGNPAREFTEAGVAEPADTRPSAETAAADAIELTAPPGTASGQPLASGAPPPVGAASGVGESSRGATVSAATPAADGRLLVRSTPSGARVFVDGEAAGETPLTLRELDLGTHGVRVVRDGYAPQERRVLLSAAEPSSSLTFELTRLGAGAPPRATTAPASVGRTEPGRYVGALIVESRPPKARVFLDGQLVGSTPLTLTDVKAGEHAIRLELEGFTRWTASVRVVASDRNRVTASLER
jgi:hypothetical protein